MNRLPSALRKYRHMVSSTGDERGTGDGCWVYLNAGFAEYAGGPHAIHADTFAACAREMESVVKCNCQDCVAETRSER